MATSTLKSESFRSKAKNTAGLRMSDNGSRAIAWLGKSGESGADIPASDREVLDVFLRMLVASTIESGAVKIAGRYYTLSVQDA